jgi:3-oxoacyl-[acyl-carrier-protein] synthase-3
MPFASIAGTGGYLPERVMENKEFEDLVSTSDEWIRERTGIERRHIAADDETTSDMALAAAHRAIEAANINVEDLDLIIIATSTGDKIFPSVACIVQRRLGISNIPAFDVNAACAGFVYALDIADRFIRTEGSSCALVIGADIYSRIIDWSDRTTCVLFGDGAGAVVLKASEKPGILSTHIHADGAHEEMLHVPGGLSSSLASMKEKGAYIRMKGNEVFKKAVSTLGKIAQETLAANNLDKHDINWLVPHQANMRIIKATAKKLDMPLERTIITVNEHANTSSASIPLAFDVAVRDGRIKRGDLLLFEGFGAGFTWGSALVRY